MEERKHNELYLQKKIIKKEKEKEETRPKLNDQVSGESYFGSIFSGWISSRVLTRPKLDNAQP